jgi:WD40 repeat protein
MDKAPRFFESPLRPPTRAQAVPQGQPTVCTGSDRTHRRPRIGMSPVAAMIFDVRLLALLAAFMGAVALLMCSTQVQNLAPMLVARGDHQFKVLSFAFSPTGGHIATLSASGRIAIRARKRSWATERFLDFPGLPMAVAFSPDGLTLAVAGKEPGVCVWDLKSPESGPTRTIPNVGRRRGTPKLTRIDAITHERPVGDWLETRGDVGMQSTDGAEGKK